MLGFSICTGDSECGSNGAKCCEQDDAYECGRRNHVVPKEKCVSESMSRQFRNVGLGGILRWMFEMRK